MNAFLSNIKKILLDQLTKREAKEPHLRMSRLGVPDRKLWFDHNSSELEVDAENMLKFTYGHIIEQLIIFLVKEAGHTVTEEQAKVEIDGVTGSKDCRIDGVTVDVKSASSFAFRKFADKSIFSNDPFGYIAQISGYAYPEAAALLAVNKENGQIAIVDVNPIDMIDPKARIKRCREVIALPEPPKEKCYPEIQEDNGNKKINKNCAYCVHKFKCWETLKVYNYSSGPEYFTEVVKPPRVEEITHRYPQIPKK